MLDREVVDLIEVPTMDRWKLLRELLVRLDLEILRETTPDYTHYELRRKDTVDIS